MTDYDRSYFRQRAEAELRAADSAEDPRAAAAHSLLAGHYLNLVHRDEAAPDVYEDSVRPHPIIQT